MPLHISKNQHNVCKGIYCTILLTLCYVTLLYYICVIKSFYLDKLNVHTYHETTYL